MRDLLTWASGMVCLCALILVSSVAVAQDKPDEAPEKTRLSFGELTKDPEDGKFDVSAYLGRGGFIPLPFVITEPALGKGLGMALAFFDNSGVPYGEDTTVSLAGAAGTTNGSKIVFAGRQGSLRSGDFKYQIAAGGGSVNLTFFPNGKATAVEFNNQAWLVNLEARARLGQSKFFLGPTLTLNRSSISPRTVNGIPLPGHLAQTIDQVAVGLALTHDTRDNTLTPKNGTAYAFTAKQFAPTLGSDSDFLATKAFGSVFYSPNTNWTFSAMALYEGTFGDTPFFMEPSISLRGVPYNRYQGDQVFSTEVEVRRSLDSRWSLVGFAGYGVSTSDGAQAIGGDFDAFIYGGGFRYTIARRLGLDLGMDYAVGPETNILYITLGHAWSRHMK